jgi:ABC-2 type transport system ATP-binding protein
MEEAEKLCDRVAIVDQGRLVALDTPQRLIEGISAEARVRFSVSNGFDPSGLHSLPAVRLAVREGEQVTVFGQNQPGRPSLLLQVAAALGEAGLAPADLHSQHSTLDDVFIALTGKHIRN